MSKKVDVYLEDENPWLDWAMENKWNILSGIAAALAVIFLLYRFLSGSVVQNEKDYFSAYNAEAKLKKADLAEKSATELKELMIKQPLLKTKVEGVLAQTFLLLDKPDEAKPLIEDNLKRIEESSFAKRSTDISLLIAQKDFKTAYSSAQKLKSDIESSGDKAYPVLYLYNMYRLQSLAASLGDKKSEQALQKEWLSLSKGSAKVGVTPLMFDAFMATLNLGDVSFLSYLQEKELQ
jgi:hypothetical protein